MKYYCPRCGNELILLKIFNKHYTGLYRCPTEPLRHFLEISDTRNVYPLQNLEIGVAEILLNSLEETIDTAFSRVKYIDYKTVSIIYFEQTLLGVYQNKEHQIVKPE